MVMDGSASSVEYRRSWFEQQMSSPAAYPVPMFLMIVLRYDGAIRWYSGEFHCQLLRGEVKVLKYR
jgi:hypothetical protein